MRILRMTMSHSQIQKKNNFQPEDQISTVYKNSSFQPEHYFLGRGFFILMILFFKQRCTRGYKRYKGTSGLIEWKECQIFHSIFT